MRFVDALKRLSNACGVMGREGEVRDILEAMLKPHVDEVIVDKLANVIAVRRDAKDYACGSHGRGWHDCQEGLLQSLQSSTKSLKNMFNAWKLPR